MSDGCKEVDGKGTDPAEEFQPCNAFGKILEVLIGGTDLPLLFQIR